MRIALIAAIFVPLTGFAQTLQPLPPPSDPLEPVTTEVQPITTVEQRASLVGLMNRAMDQYAMHAKGTPAHMLQISFNATASTLFPGGAGHLRETWISGQNWRWEATLDSYSLLRISSDGVAYDEQAPRPIPLRLKMLANAVFAPMQPRAPSLRTASANWKGLQVTCALTSFPMMRQAAATPATGRQWDETEYCIDPATSLLMVYSEVPGIYVAYDYSSALRFHDRTLPGSITVTENGTVVLRAQLTSIVDTDPSNVSPFTPTTQMKAHGPAVVLYQPIQFVNPVFSKDIQPGTPVEPTIVHVTFNEEGIVQESELLQTSGLSAQALDVVTKMKFRGAPNASGAPPRQREAYIRVEFLPAPAGMRMQQIRN
jgi:hypothetical protein